MVSVETKRFWQYLLKIRRDNLRVWSRYRYLGDVTGMESLLSIMMCATIEYLRHELKEFHLDDVIIVKRVGSTEAKFYLSRWGNKDPEKGIEIKVGVGSEEAWIHVSIREGETDLGPGAIADKILEELMAYVSSKVENDG